MVRSLTVLEFRRWPTQNADYVLSQLEAFANRTRANDINMPMRTIAALAY